MASLEACLSVQGLSFESQSVKRSSSLSYILISRVTKEGFLAPLDSLELLSF